MINSSSLLQVLKIRTDLWPKEVKVMISKMFLEIYLRQVSKASGRDPNKKVSSVEILLSHFSIKVK